MEYKEIFRLKEMLEEANIPFEWDDNNFMSSDGYKIIINSKDGTYLCDCIENIVSYGNKEDKLEIMGGLTEEESENDSVLGWLTAEEVFKRFKYCYENNTSKYKEIINMEKSDLRYGDIVEARNGIKYVVYHNGSEKALVSLISGWCVGLDEYNENLTSAKDYTNFDIMKVYKDYTCKELLWERKEKPQLTEDEKVILRNVPKHYKWIARDIDSCLYVYTSKPKKGITMWESDGLPMIPFISLFDFIKWEDDEPYSIEDLLKGE